MKKHQPFDLGWILFVAVIGFLVYRGIQYHRILNRLHFITPQHVVGFRIYPTGIPPSTEFQEFPVSGPLVMEFLQSLSDTRAYYWATRDDIHAVFVEIKTEQEVLQISLYHPHYKKGVLAGEVGKWGPNGASFFGSFRSRQLLQWYQKYEQVIEGPQPHGQKAEESSTEKHEPP